MIFALMKNNVVTHTLALSRDACITLCARRQTIQSIDFPVMYYVYIRAVHIYALFYVFVTLPFIRSKEYEAVSVEPASLVATFQCDIISNVV